MTCLYLFKWNFFGLFRFRSWNSSHGWNKFWNHSSILHFHFDLWTLDFLWSLVALLAPLVDRGLTLTTTSWPNEGGCNWTGVDILSAITIEAKCLVFWVSLSYSFLFSVSCFALLCCNAVALHHCVSFLISFTWNNYLSVPISQHFAPMPAYLLIPTPPKSDDFSWLQYHRHCSNISNESLARSN